MNVQFYGIDKMVIYMKILKLFKIKSNPIDYEKDTYWYTNNYNMLGYRWLYDALKKMNLKKDFSLLSPSANIGMYESDTYDNLRKDGYNPTFYLSDLNSGKLKNKAKEREHFFWILGYEIDASEIKISNIKEDGTVPIKFDVILDCKGATWHYLNDDKKIDNVIKLLKKYCELLEIDDSKLLVDCGMPNIVREVADTLINSIYPINKIRREEMKMHFFCEFSTFYFLTKYIGDKETKEFFHPIQLKIKNKNLIDNFDIAYCTKKELMEYVEKIEKISQEKFNKNIENYKMRKKKFSRFSSVIFAIVICLVIIMLVIMFFCYCR